MDYFLEVLCDSGSAWVRLFTQAWIFLCNSYKTLCFDAKMHEGAHNCKVLGGMFTMCQVPTVRWYMYSCIIWFITFMIQILFVFLKSVEIVHLPLVLVVVYGPYFAFTSNSILVVCGILFPDNRHVYFLDWAARRVPAFWHKRALQLLSLTL